MNQRQITIRFTMPRTWFALCAIGAILSPIGVATSSIPILSITLTLAVVDLTWYAIYNRRF